MIVISNLFTVIDERISCFFHIPTLRGAQVLVVFLNNIIFAVWIIISWL